MNRYKYTGPGEVVMRPSPLGNPFSHKPLHNVTQVSSREEAIRRYREWLRDRYAEGRGGPYEELMRLVGIYRRGGELTLVCCCAPKSCHADVVADAVRGIAGAC